MGRRQKRTRKKIPWKKLFSGVLKFIFKLIPPVLIVAALGFALWSAREALYSDSFFHVRAITVSPPLGISNQQRVLLETRYFGKHILSVDLEEIARELEKDPEIRHAQVLRYFPSTLAVSVDRRDIFAAVRFQGKNKWGLISEDGMILQVVDKIPGDKVQIEAGSLDASALKIGYLLRHKGFAETVRFLKVFLQDKMAQNYSLSKIAFDALGNVTIFLGNSPEIRLGRSPASRLGSLEKITHLLNDKEVKQIAYFDLQFDNVIVRKK